MADRIRNDWENLDCLKEFLGIPRICRTFEDTLLSCEPAAFLIRQLNFAKFLLERSQATMPTGKKKQFILNNVVFLCVLI